MAVGDIVQVPLSDAEGTVWQIEFVETEDGNLMPRHADQDAVDALMQLVRKIPALNVDLNQQLRVNANGGSFSVYPRTDVNSSTYEVLALKGQHYSSLRWQQQRALITV